MARDPGSCGPEPCQSRRDHQRQQRSQRVTSSASTPALSSQAASQLLPQYNKRAGCSRRAGPVTLCRKAPGAASCCAGSAPASRGPCRFGGSGPALLAPSRCGSNESLPRVRSRCSYAGPSPPAGIPDKSGGLAPFARSPGRTGAVRCGRTSYRAGGRRRAVALLASQPCSDVAFRSACAT
jgi:hypothetical protein